MTAHLGDARASTRAEFPDGARRAGLPRIVGDLSGYLWLPNVHICG